MAFVALLDPTRTKPDALAVVDLEPGSRTYGQMVGRVDMPNPGDELHHFGWNACSSCLCPYSPHPHMERRYLVVPGMRSSRIHVIDTKPDPRRPKIVKVIEPETVMRRTGYSRPHTVHCGPDGIYLNALGSPEGEGPGGIFIMDPETFEVRGRWELDRGPQHLTYDFWWHLGCDTLITSEWGTPNMYENGVNPELLLAGKYGHQLHVWDLRRRRHRQVLDLGAEQQMVLELRPAHDPAESYGFLGVVTSLKDLSASVWLWYRDKQNGNGEFKVRKVIEIPAEPADPESLPPLLKGFKAVPPLVTDLNLSLDDRYLYVSCWGTGELQQYDVSDPFSPKLTGSIKIGGIVRRASHPSKQNTALNGGPQMVEISRDGRRVYLTNSLYSSWDEQFYPDGIRGWMAKINVGENGGMRSRSGLPAGVRRVTPPPGAPGGWGRFLGFLLLLGVSHGNTTLVTSDHDPVARRLSWHQSRYGLALRRRLRHARAAARSGVAGSDSAHARTRDGHRRGDIDRRGGGGCRARRLLETAGGGDARGIGRLPPGPPQSLHWGWHASRDAGTYRLVVSDGHLPRRRAHGPSCLSRHDCHGPGRELSRPGAASASACDSHYSNAGAWGWIPDRDRGGGLGGVHQTRRRPLAQGMVQPGFDLGRRPDRHRSVDGGGVDARLS